MLRESSAESPDVVQRRIPKMGALENSVSCSGNSAVHRLPGGKKLSSSRHKSFDELLTDAKRKHNILTKNDRLCQNSSRRSPDGGDNIFVRMKGR